MMMNMMTAMINMMVMVMALMWILMTMMIIIIDSHRVDVAAGVDADADVHDVEWR